MKDEANRRSRRVRRLGALAVLLPLTLGSGAQTSLRWPAQPAAGNTAIAPATASLASNRYAPTLPRRSAPPLGADFDVRQFEAMAQQLVADQRVPGLAMAIVHNGRVLSARGYGITDTRAPEAVDGHTVFRLASLSKGFAGTMAGLLVNDGTLRWDSKVTDYVPGFRLNSPEATDRLTVADVLSHRVGLPYNAYDRDIEGNAEYYALTQKLANTSLKCLPGDCYAYQNVAFSLIGDVVFAASGTFYDQAVDRRIFKPLGMTHTRWRDDHGDVVPGRTGAYEFDDGVYRNDQVIEDAYGNGGLLTTVGDLVKWQAALDADTFGAGFTAEMQTPTKLNDGTPIAYALALVNLDHHGQQEVSHSGSTGGYRAWMARYPQHKLAVSLLCNSGNADTPVLGRDVADIFLPAYKAKAYTSKGPLPSGTYADGMTGFPVRFDSDDKGNLRADGRVLTPVGPGRWAQREDIFAFGKTGLTLEHREGEKIAYRKVDAVTAFDAKPYVGRFCGVDTFACLSFKQQGDTLTYSGPRWYNTPLSPAYADVFTGEAAPGAGRITVKFERDASGAVTALRFGEGRAYDVAFRRVAD